MTLPVRHDDCMTLEPASSSARTHVIIEQPKIVSPANSIVRIHPAAVVQADVAQNGFVLSADNTIDCISAGSQCVADEVDRVGYAVRDAVGEHNFQHWFHKRTRFSIAGDRLIVHVANPFILNWLLRRFRTALNQAAMLVLGPSATAQLEVDESLMTQPTAIALIPSELNFDTTMAIPITGRSDLMGTLGSQTPSPLSSNVSEATSQGVSRRHGRTATNASASNSSGSHSSSPDRTSNLNLPTQRRRYRSFDSLVCGDCNQLAIVAAKQIAADPGQRYNPLFIYGGTGTGKTHILEAIYTDVRRKHPQKNVMSLTSEAFTNYFTSALTSRTVPSFRQRFRTVDVLLIDNIEFLDNKKATQEEFLHTIVQVIEHGGQVVISSDRHPRMLTKHREELTTRFLSGLVCRVEAMDEMTRQKLVRSLAGPLKAVFADDALDYIARRCRKNAREIQGALNQLESQFALNGRRVTLAVARDILGEMEDECRRLVRISDVEKVVCDAFGVSATDLRSPSRRKAVAVPRAIAMFLSRRLTKSAYREIGMYFGGRDHSTVVAAERKVVGWVASSEVVGLPVSCSGRTFSELVEELEHRLQTLAS
jgi:chromosomal replication initiator protein